MTNKPASSENSATVSQNGQKNHFFMPWCLLVITTFLILTGIVSHSLYICAVSEEVEAKIVEGESTRTSWLNFLAFSEYRAVYQYNIHEFNQPVSLGLSGRRALEKGKWPILVKRSSPDQIHAGSKGSYYLLSIISFVTAIISLVLFIVFSRQDLKRAELSQES